ncbi:mitochondrial MRF1 N(5)-glutamine methyltransferase Mtq1p [[Candida] anglica]|uniref:peptide chain release factor N(5)-glutamine methyltransferase n=1 Tax=[Candida] anglica TaxID=148631 RepID=A0ABP0EJS9_9ASCO
MRISPRLIREARNHSPLLPYLLRANRNIERAAQELKWIQNELAPSQWKNAVIMRHNLHPLQYILGSQPFGSLDIKCRENVLIPRPETEEWVLKLCSILQHRQGKQRKLQIVDACTGSGCIGLLTKYELQDDISMTMFDISEHAVELSMENQTQYSSLDANILQLDLSDVNLADKLPTQQDLILSNPPYIPLSDYKRPVLLNGVEESVRLYEPQLALVGENEFYSMLLENLVKPTSANGFVFELGYREQAQFIRNNLGDDWICGVYYDYNDNIRCSIGWRVGSEMSYLQDMCNEILKIDE